MRMGERAICLVSGIEEEAAASRRRADASVRCWVSTATGCGWMKQAQIDAGKRPENVRFARHRSAR
jgi:hypothetical protein